MYIRLIVLIFLVSFLHFTCKIHHTSSLEQEAKTDKFYEIIVDSLIIDGKFIPSSYESSGINDKYRWYLDYFRKKYFNSDYFVEFGFSDQDIKSFIEEVERNHIRDKLPPVSEEYKNLLITEFINQFRIDIIDFNRNVKYRQLSRSKVDTINLSNKFGFIGMGNQTGKQQLINGIMCKEYNVGGDYYYVTNKFPSMQNDAIDFQFDGFVMKAIKIGFGEKIELTFDLQLVDCPQQFFNDISSKVNIPWLSFECKNSTDNNVKMKFHETSNTMERSNKSCSYSNSGKFYSSHLKEYDVIEILKYLKAIATENCKDLGGVNWDLTEIKTTDDESSISSHLVRYTEKIQCYCHKN